MSYALGVDVGTMATAAAVTTAEGARVLELGTRRAAIPSIVALNDAGRIITGEAAARKALTDPPRAAREFKRRLGDSTTILVAGSPFSAEDLTSKLLVTVVEFATSRLDGPPAHVVLTHPATYGEFKRDTLAQAAAMAGLSDWSFLSEPEAAGLEYAAKRPVRDGERLAVYDLGGGTFDATVIRRAGDGFEVAGLPGGIERLGGVDFDAAVLGFVRSHLEDADAAVMSDDTDMVTAWVGVREDCREAKEALSSDSEAVLPLTLPGRPTQRIRILRTEFESMIEPKIIETIEALGRVVESAQLTFEDIERILLVGGSSRIPLVADMVGRLTGCDVHQDAHPKHAVALGAARAGRRRIRAPNEPTSSDPTLRWDQIRRAGGAGNTPPQE